MSDKTICKRNSSLEMLRIIVALGVIVLHYNSYAKQFIVEGSWTEYYLWLTDCLFACSVDVFVLISAFFLSSTYKRNSKKIIELVAQFVLFRIGYYLALTITGDFVFDLDTFINLLLPVNYFIVLYSVLYVISPYINIIIFELSDKEFRRLLVLLVCLFSIETWIVDVLYRISDKTYDGLSTVGLLGSQNGFTIVNFVLLYFIGAYIQRNYEKICEIKTVRVLSALILIWSIMFLSIFAQKNGMDLAVQNYNSPFVIVFAAVVMIFFLRLKIDSKIINELSKATFTCYIVQSI